MVEGFDCEGHVGEDICLKSMEVLTREAGAMEVDIASAKCNNCGALELSTSAKPEHCRCCHLSQEAATEIRE